MRHSKSIGLFAGALALGLAAAVAATAPSAGAPAVRSTALAPAATTAPGPYPKMFLGRDIPFQCTGPDGAVIYQGQAWTLPPNIRGPLFAPTVLWLQDIGNQPIVPLTFVTTGFPIFWVTDDGGPHAEGIFEHAEGRPVAYGSVATDTAPMVSCGYSMLGHFNFGSYVMTPSLVAMLGIPADMVGRSLAFDGEGTVNFKIPKYQFPLTATVKGPVSATPDATSYPAINLPTVSCLATVTGQTLYHGAAITAAPLIRGYRWSPMAFWLTGDRIVTPRWFTTVVTGSWHTASGSPARSGTLDATERQAPSGYGPRQSATFDVDCSYSGHDNTTMKVTSALATQLGLPTDVIGRNVTLRANFRVDALTGTWLFPPA
jgi:hypothetical protein